MTRSVMTVDYDQMRDYSHPRHRRIAEAVEAGTGVARATSTTGYVASLGHVLSTTQCMTDQPDTAIIAAASRIIAAASREGAALSVDGVVFGLLAPM